jgi:SAM-dependent methyltransferase
MARTPAHPLAKHPLDQLDQKFQCSAPLGHRAYLNTFLLEASLSRCGKYVHGVTLDVGCGRKPYEKTFFSRATKYVGMDYLTDRSAPDIVGSATDIPLDKESFDTVVCTEVLEHVADPLKALREMHRVLKPGGYLVLSTPMYWPRHEVPYDYFRYPYDGLLHLVKESGFELVELYNRGRSYAFIGQAIQQTQPIGSRLVTWLINRFFLWCDTHLQHDIHTLGWTFVARKPLLPTSPSANAGA